MMRHMALLASCLIAWLGLMPHALGQTQSELEPDTAIAWQVETSPLDTPDAKTQTLRNARYGVDWASWSHPDGTSHFLDLPSLSLIEIDADNQSAKRTNLYAEARRRLDIYVALSEGGRRDVINFGAAGAFDRIWLEAAMGLSNQASSLNLIETPLGFAALYEGQVVFAADYGTHEDSKCVTAPLTGPSARSALAWLPYAAPTHPDVLQRLHTHNSFPCAFSFVVYSPDSPMGRRERWMQTPSETRIPETPPLSDALVISPAGAERLEPVIRAAQDILGGHSNAALDPVGFFDEVETLRLAQDYAGALLAGVQETHHFGPCPEAAIGSIRLTCANASALALEGQLDPDFIRASEGIQALDQERFAEAVDKLSTFLDREGHAGAAARTLTANALVAWGRVGLQARPDLDPASLLAESVILDPYAPDTYWYLGQRYLAAGAPAPAWTLFDIGRALPGREPTPLLSQADTLEDRMQELAPYWLPQSADAG